MARGRFALIAVAAVSVFMMSGCVSQQQYNDLKSQNRIQQERITGMENELNASRLRLAELQQQLETLRGQSGVDIEARRAEIAALEKDIEAKKALIEKMQAQLLRSGAPLPMELNVLLQDFAKTNEAMVSFDEATGALKFKSDLLFELGSDTVAAAAVEPIKQLCAIMNSQEGGKFDIIIAGHTDDVPIRKAETRAKHPTNWYLSVHRSISVLDVMTAGGVVPSRLSVRGFGEYRPVAENKANKGGNAANRRVEIFIVPSGL